MDAKKKNAMVNALMSKFIQLYTDKYGQAPRFNRNTERWGYAYLVDDLGIEAFPTLEYYFTLKRHQTSSDFLKTYEELNQWRREDEEDEVNRRTLLEQTKKRVEEFEQRWQKP